MDSNPDLSVIVPVYNVDPFLEEALDSVLLQSYGNFEVIAVNDGSTDKSGEILDYYAQKDSRISVFHREHEGLSSARNFGLAKAGGKYIYFFDSDDRLVPGMFEKVLGIMSGSKSEICTFSGICINNEGERIPKRKKYSKPASKITVNGDQLFINMVEEKKYSPVVSMYLYAASLLKKHNLRFSSGYIHEDEAFTVKAVCLAERAISIPDIFYEHRIRQDSIMGRERSLENVKGWLRAYTEIIEFSEKTRINYQAYLYLQYRANHLMNVAMELFEALKENGKIPNLNMWKFVDANDYRPFDSFIKTRYYAPFLYRVINRLRWMYSSAYFNMNSS